MIIFNIYHGDTNEILKLVQHDCYMCKVSFIFEQAKRRFIQADAIIQSNLPIIKDLRAIEKIDHRVLQDAHDIIAAAYRYYHDDGGQLNLFRQDTTLENYYINKWTEWYEEKIKALIECPDFVSFVVLSVLNMNTKTGYDFEHRLCDFLMVHFSMGDWAGDVSYMKTYPEIF